MSSKATQSTKATASRTTSETSRASTPSAARKPPPRYGIELVDGPVAQCESDGAPPLAANASPPSPSAGRPLEPSTRSHMESKFGQSFAAVRVHDDAYAHASAKALRARAYTIGNDVVFAAGQYRRDTAAGTALLAHELAHTIQQAGLSRKADGPAPEHVPIVNDSRLETQADQAALAVTGDHPMPALSRVAAPAILRDDATTPPPPVATPTPAAAPPTTPTVAAPSTKLPAGMTPVVDIPPGVGTDMLIVSIATFTLPKEKGKGAWVQPAYDEAGTGGRLVFSPVIQTSSIAAYKEDSQTAEYLNAWLRKFGFKTTQELAAAFVASTDQKVVDAMKDAGVNKLITGMKTGLSKSGCDIDHIVEKQLAGTSIPNNLQLLDSKKNQESGRETYAALKGLVNSIRDPSNRGDVRNIQIRFGKITVPTGTDDASFVVEGLLRSGTVKGANAAKLVPNSASIVLSAGNVNAACSVQDKGETAIDASASRLISGVRLTHYTRGALGPRARSTRSAPSWTAARSSSPNPPRRSWPSTHIWLPR